MKSRSRHRFRAKAFTSDESLWTPEQLSAFIWHESDSVSGSGSTAQWDDLSGNGRHSTQGTAANEPITGVSTLNGLNVLDFNNDFLSLDSDSYYLLGGNYTIIILAKTNATASSQSLINFSAVGTVGSLRYESAANTIEFGSGSFTGLEREGVTKDQFNIFVARRNGTTLGLSVNGDTETTNTAATDATPTNANIGTFSDGIARNLDGSIAAILIYDSSLSQSNIIDLNVGYLAHKWGLAAELPSNHPYKDAAPKEGGSVLANTVAPVASGFVITGQTLSVTDGTWTNATSFTYQWKRAGVAISGATSNTYAVVSDDEGNAITCDVMADGSVTATSNSLTFTKAITGLTLDATWTDPSSGAWENALTPTSARARSSAAVYTTFDNTDTGIIMETGATGAGLALYIYDGVLYFQCGDGGNAGSDADTAEISWTIPNSTPEFYFIEWSANTTTNIAELFVNGVSVGTDTFNENKIAGTDDGGIGRAHDVGTPVNRGGWTGNNSGVFTGSIEKVEIFAGEAIV